MKGKAIFFIMATCVAGTIPANARLLSVDEAMDRAAAEMPLPSRSAGVRLVDTAYASGRPTYYVIESGEAVYFLGADDLALPVLGYIPNGSYDPGDLPANMQAFLDSYSREIAWAETSSLTVDAAAARRIAGSRAGRSSIEPMLVTSWNQGAPYNLLCPTLGGSATMTGCVATAMAQTLYHYRDVVAPHGSISYLWESGNTVLSLDFGACDFNWSKMLKTYTLPGINPTQAHKDAVALLMQACGYSVEMDYGTDSSGAYSFMVPGAMRKYFGFDNAIETKYRDYYTATEWDDMVYAALVDYGPMIYDGNSSGGVGHSFVCDGYDAATGKYHFNWGWGGSCDGYFSLSALNPGAGGAGAGTGNFSSDQDAVFGIQAPQPGSKVPAPYMAERGNYSGTFNAAGVTLTGTYLNSGEATAMFDMGLIYEDLEGNLAGSAYSMSTGELPPFYGWKDLGLPTAVPVTVAAGTHRVYAAYRLSGSREWKKMPTTSLTKYYSFYFNGNRAPGAVIADFWQDRELWVRGTQASVSLDLQNLSNSSTESATVYVQLYQMLPGGKLGSRVCQLGAAAAATLTPLQRKVVQVAGTLPGDLDAGIYFLAFVKGDGTMYFDPVEVKIADSTSGIGDINAGGASTQGTPRCYDLQGRPVDAERPLHGIFIETDGHSVRKIVR